MLPRTLRLYFILATSLLSLRAAAQGGAKAPEQQSQEQVAGWMEKPVPLFYGVSVSADVVGFAMKAMGSDYAQMEVACRINLKDKYMPIVECGYGTADRVGDETDNTFHTQAPYFRIGMDYNFSKRKRSGNRLYAGVRYAFTSFNYDIGDPNFSDPVWDITRPLDMKGLNGRAQWGEIVFGMEARIWSIFHLGWSVRYKSRFKHKESPYGQPWYVPGFGKNGSTCLGGTFNVIFEI